MISSTMIGALAAQPTQQYNKILLNPFYINGMTQNLNYTYNVSVITPDGISTVKSAIITLDAWINPTRTFNAWMNNVQCNTKNYTISTTYASAGRGVVTFDCTNAIQPNKINTVRFVVSGGNIGASTSWLDLTYMNNPKGDLELHGTEYNYNQNAKLWLQLLTNNGSIINDGVCFLHVYTPDNTQFIEGAQMNSLNEEGIYYYDLLAPLQQGIYPAVARCFYTAGEVKFYPQTIQIERGTAVFTNLDSAFYIDGNFFRYTENAPNPRRVILNWTTPAVNWTTCANTPENLMTGLNVFIYATFDSVLNDDITIDIYNWTSNAWIELPNKILEGPGYKSVSNFINTKNITRDGYYSSVNGIRIRTRDTTLTDTANNNFDVDQIYIGCDQLASPEWQEIKGSSEMHITSDKLYQIQFDSLSFTPQKINYYNVTVGSATSGNVTDVILDIPIYYAYICGAIEEVRREENGSMVLVNWSYSKARETILDSCNLVILQNLSKGQNYYYSIKLDDKWQEYSEARLSRAEFLDEYIRAGCDFYRTSFSYPAYEVPLVTIPNESFGLQYSVCNYYLDSFYQLNNSVHDNIINKFSVPVTYTDEKDVKEIEADVLEIASLTEQLVVIADSIIQEWIVANSYSTTILGYTNVTPVIIQYWSNLSSSWAIYNKNVTALVNTTEISIGVWNYSTRNLTYYEVTSINYSVLWEGVWNYTGRYVDGVLI